VHADAERKKCGEVGVLGLKKEGGEPLKGEGEIKKEQAVLKRHTENKLARVGRGRSGKQVGVAVAGGLDITKNQNTQREKGGEEEKGKGKNKVEREIQIVTTLAQALSIGVGTTDLADRV